MLLLRPISAVSQALTLLPLLTIALLTPQARAQHKGRPGEFDYYLLNLSWEPEFCSIEGTSPACSTASAAGFIVHGLWPQKNDGTWPVYCADRPGPADPRANLDITPDLSLLQHEWSKHGTCTTLSAQDFFAAEHRADRAVTIPAFFRTLRRPTQSSPAAVLALFTRANPTFPADSFALSCGRNHLTAIEVCYSKQLRPTPCQNLHSCRAPQITIDPPSH